MTCCHQQRDRPQYRDLEVWKSGQVHDPPISWNIPLAVLFYPVLFYCLAGSSDLVGAI